MMKKVAVAALGVYLIFPGSIVATGYGLWYLVDLLTNR